MDQLGVTERADDVRYNLPPVPTAMTMFAFTDGDSAVMACSPALSAVLIIELEGEGRRGKKRECAVRMLKREREREREDKKREE